ncbi:hypothetical protein HY485_01235, partial [Candidatus Woesearchaeota archaeon]|nr:hypothetical protein [Candidatus Woesearchaeota archaeon]
TKMTQENVSQDYVVELHGTGEQVEFGAVYTANDFPALKTILENAFKKLRFAGSLTFALNYARVAENKALCYFPSINNTNYWTGTVINADGGLVGVLIPNSQKFYETKQPNNDLVLTRAPQLKGKPEPFAALALVKGNVAKESIEDALNKIDAAIRNYKNA